MVVQWLAHPAVPPLARPQLLLAAVASCLSGRHQAWAPRGALTSPIHLQGGLVPLAGGLPTAQLPLPHLVLRPPVLCKAAQGVIACLD